MRGSMTGQAATLPKVAEIERRQGLLLALPALAMLGLQVGLFIWMAPRGIDFTDESYYLLSYLHWREITATATFFGAYFEWPFRLLGQSVGAIRVFGMGMLLCAGAFFTWSVMAFKRDQHGHSNPDLAFVIVGMVSTLFYYSYVTTLRAPSYNLLVLFCMLVATGLLLCVLEGRVSHRQQYVAMTAYGLVLGACALAKATSAVAMLVCHGVFFAVFNQQRRALEWGALALSGAALNFILLEVLQPRWFQVLRDGVTITTTLDGRYTSIQFAPLLDAIVRGAARLLPILVFAALMFFFAARGWGRSHRAVRSLLVVLLVAGLMLTVQFQGYAKAWWLLILFGTTLLWLAERLWCDLALRTKKAPSALGLSILMFALPVAYSIGTNGSLPAHSQMAAVFGVMAILLPLRILSERALIHRSALAASLALLCLPTGVSQLRSLTDPDFTYRLRHGLIDQRFSLGLGAAGDSLLVDAVTHDAVAAFVRAMHDAGYVEGEPILDVTGDGPGLVYALGGRPVGVPWLIGGYLGSERVMALVLGRVPVTTLQRAWVVSADDNPRALQSWAPILQELAGGPSRALAGTAPYRAQYRWDGRPAEPLTLSLWRPIGLAPASMPERSP